MRLSWFPFLMIGLFLNCVATAQSIGFGLRSGLGQACHHRYFDRDYEGSFDLRPVLSKVVGIHATVGLSMQLAIEVGVQYEEKGNIRYAFKNQYRYASLPLTLKWSLLKQQTVVPYVRVGGYYAYLLHHKRGYIDQGPIFDIYLPEYQTTLRNTDFGLIAALGADCRLSPHIRVNLDLNGSRGLRGLYKDNSSSLALYIPYYNINWIAAAGVQYVF